MLQALTYYEFLITFSQEITVIWSRKFTLPALLFVFTRWIAIWSVTNGTSEDFDWHSNVSTFDSRSTSLDAVI